MDFHTRASTILARIESYLIVKFYLDLSLHTGLIIACSSAGRDVGSLLRDLEGSVKPTIVDRNGRKIAQYTFDVKGFQPEEITIKTVDNNLEISAKHEEKRTNGEISHAYKRTITIPEGINADELQGKLVQDGLLRVEAPYRPSALTDGSRMIPITRGF